MTSKYAYTIRITDEYHCSLTVCVLSDDKMENTDLYNWAHNRFPGTEEMVILSKANTIEIK